MKALKTVGIFFYSLTAGIAIAVLLYFAFIGAGALLLLLFDGESFFPTDSPLLRALKLASGIYGLGSVLAYIGSISYHFARDIDKKSMIIMTLIFFAIFDGLAFLFFKEFGGYTAIMATIPIVLYIAFKRPKAT